MTEHPRRAGAASVPPTSSALLVSATSSGTLVLLSFPPFGLGPLMWFALTPMFAVHQRIGRRTLLLYGYLLAAVPIWPIAFGIAASSFATFAVFALCVPLAFAAAIVGATALEARLAHPLAKLFVFPCFAVALEWVLGMEHVGVPATIALTQASTPLLIQNADLVGTAGTTFLLLLVNRAIVMAPEATLEPRTLAPIAVAICLFAANLAYGRHRLTPEGDHGPTFRVASLQPAIPTADYVNRRIDDTVQGRIDHTVDNLIDRALQPGPDLLVLSEGGNGRYNFRVPTLRRRLEDAARRSRAGLLVSSLDLTPGDEEYNALFSLGADGRLLGTYRKGILTPVGEAHLHAGEDRTPLPSAIGPVGAMVCFESCFPGVATALVRNGAAFLLVSTSDASFRNSALPLLHSSFSTFRAIETRRYLLQAANTGPSLIIAPTGVVTSRTPFLARGILHGRLAARHGETFFVRAPWLAPAAAIAFLALALVVPDTRRLVVSPHATPHPRPIRLDAFRRRTPWALGYGASIAAFTVASIQMATHATVADRGVVANLSAFLAEPPEPNVRATAERFLQRDANTCGPAALAYLLHLHGIDVGERDIAPRVHLDADGTSLFDLARAAETFGVEPHGERLNLAALRQAGRPMIAHLPSSNHFVVVLGVEGGSVFLFDPAFGPTVVSEEDFSRAWDGAVLRIGFPALADVDGHFDPVTEPAPGGGMLVTTHHQPDQEGETTWKPNDS